MMTPKTVQGDVKVNWTPAVVATAASTGAFGIGVLSILGFLAIPGIIGGVIVWAIMSRRKKSVASPQA